jgi:hypothetical protein
VYNPKRFYCLELKTISNTKDTKVTKETKKNPVVYFVPFVLRFLVDNHGRVPDSN